MDDQNLLDLVESTDEETPSLSDKYESIILSVDDIMIAETRKEKSLGNLAKKFVDLLKNTPNGVININEVVDLHFYFFVS